MRVARTETFAVHTYEVDAFQALAAPALAGYLQEVAGLHAADMGCGIEALRERGLTWVLSRQRIEIDLPVAVGDSLEVATWPAGVDRLFALRDFEVTRKTGERVARASTCWLVMDLAKRRPVRPDRVLSPEYLAPLGQALPPSPAIAAVETPDAERAFRIRYADIDHNLHVTNTTYLGWALESVSEETWRNWRLSSVEVHFLAECVYGSRVLSRVRGRPEGEVLHGILREEDGRELARISTRWQRRLPAGVAAPP